MPGAFHVVKAAERSTSHPKSIIGPDLRSTTLTIKSNNIQAIEINLLRISARISRKNKIRNSISPHEKKMKFQDTILDYIKTQQLECYDHVQRMEEERLPKCVLEWIPEGRRGRGRPKVS